MLAGFALRPMTQSNRWGVFSWRLARPAIGCPWTEHRKAVCSYPKSFDFGGRHAGSGQWVTFQEFNQMVYRYFRNKQTTLASFDVERHPETCPACLHPPAQGGFRDSGANDPSRCAHMIVGLPFDNHEMTRPALARGMMLRLLRHCRTVTAYCETVKPIMSRGKRRSPLRRTWRHQ